MIANREKKKANVNLNVVEEAEKKDTFLYLFYLDSRFNSLDKFKKNWDKIPDLRLSAEEVVNLLHKTSKHLKNSQQYGDEIKYHIQENFAPTQRILQKKLKNDEFDAQSMSNTLWALATLRLDPGEEFMSIILEKLW